MEDLHPVVVLELDVQNGEIHRIGPHLVDRFVLIRAAKIT